jgi:hypothetical protein
VGAGGEGGLVKTVLKVVGALLVVLAAGLWIDRQRHLPPPPPTALELKALQDQRDALQKALSERIVAAGEKSLSRAPRAGVMIGMPTSLVRRIAEQVVTGLFRQTTLTLRNLHVSKDGEVKAKMVFRKKKVGKFELDVDIHEVKGLLQPGKPELSFAHEKIGIRMPVALAKGSGSASIHFVWDSKGLAANMVCGDVDITREVTGGVRPEEYRVSGAFGISSAGEEITLRPDFGELAVRIFVVPSQQAWEVVDGVVAEQRGGCRMALEKMNIKAILGKLLDKGFNVKIPKKIFKPVRIPAGVRASLNVQGVKLDLQATPTALLVAEDRLWYGSDLSARRATTPAPE